MKKTLSAGLIALLTAYGCAVNRSVSKTEPPNQANAIEIKIAILQSGIEFIQPYSIIARVYGKGSPIDTLKGRYINHLAIRPYMNADASQTIIQEMDNKYIYENIPTDSLLNITIEEYYKIRYVNGEKITQEKFTKSISIKERPSTPMDKYNLLIPPTFDEYRGIRILGEVKIPPDKE